MELVTLRNVVHAEANWGRWVVKCPVCTDALKMTPGAEVFRCWGCSAEAEVLWPPNHAAIQRLLMMRPLAQTRNWVPGESLSDLVAENIAHGIGPTEPGQELLVVGDQIVLDTLPASPARLMIGA